MKKITILLSIFSSLLASTPAEDAIKTYLPPQGKVLDIQIIDPNKGIIELSDNSSFKILPKYETTLKGWLFGVKVTVTPLHGKSTTYLIQDIKTKQIVKATKVSQ